MRAIILDAYRRSNAGDGLLVDETAALIREAFPGASITLVSMDPSSFPEYAVGYHPVAGHGERMRVSNLLARALTRKAHPSVVTAIRDADIAVAVGGGYIRADSLAAMGKAFLSHMVQAPNSSNTTPYVYLPQSIGPLPPRFVPFGIRRLTRAHAIFVRDDRSKEELERRGVSTTRLPDLAAIAIGSNSIEIGSAGAQSRPALVARALAGRNRQYEGNLTRLSQRIRPEMLIQSSGAGNDDPAFYDSQGWCGPHRKLLDALASTAQPSVVVSVRLHGSLQSILAGVPSIHLSYERKGWGAYEDLGIGEYVHNAWSFDPELVSDQTRKLSRDASGFWSAIERQRPTLVAARRQLIETLRSAVFQVAH